MPSPLKRLNQKKTKENLRWEKLIDAIIYENQLKESLDEIRTNHYNSIFDTVCPTLLQEIHKLEDSILEEFYKADYSAEDFTKYYLDKDFRWGNSPCKKRYIVNIQQRFWEDLEINRMEFFHQLAITGSLKPWQLRRYREYIKFQEENDLL